MIFITLITFKKTAPEVSKITKHLLETPPSGIKIIGTYWTLGKVDAVWIYDAPNEKVSLEFALSMGAVADTETLIGVPRDEALKMGIGDQTTRLP